VLLLARRWIPRDAFLQRHASSVGKPAYRARRKFRLGERILRNLRVLFHGWRFQWKKPILAFSVSTSADRPDAALPGFPSLQKLGNLFHSADNIDSLADLALNSSEDNSELTNYRGSRKTESEEKKEARRSKWDVKKGPFPWQWDIDFKLMNVGLLLRRAGITHFPEAGRKCTHGNLLCKVSWLRQGTFLHDNAQKVPRAAPLMRFFLTD